MSRELQLPKVAPLVEPPAVVRTRARKRVRLMRYALLTLLAGVGLRGMQLCVDPGDLTVRAAAVQRWGEVTLSAERGEIIDRHGRRLATSVATPNIVADPLLIQEDGADADLVAQIAEILGLPVDEVRDKCARNSRYAKLAARVHPSVAARIDALDHPGLFTERNSRRYYPEERLASQVLGYVDVKGVGKSGLEASLDRYLRGSSVVLQRRRDRRGLAVDGPMQRDDHVGMDVHTTLDRTIQRSAERAIDNIFERSKPMSASITVVDVRSGDVLAIANGPSFNPNAVGSDPAPRKNHAVQDAIEPGSVFKPYAVAAAVEEGLVRAETLVSGEGGAYFIGRARIRDDHPKGTITVSEVIKYSSNIGTAKMALQLGPERLLGYLRAFGFGERTGVPLPGERMGTMRKPSLIKPIELATTSYGQGITSTQLQLTMATAAIANGGVRMRPRLVTRVVDAWGVPEYLQEPEAVTRVISEKTAREVAKMMLTVTEKGGTGTRAAVPGYLVAGKTGTAEKVKDGRYGSGRIGSFIGFIPADDPVLAIVVTVDEPTQGSRYGGIVAAPAFAEVAGEAMRYLGVPANPELLPSPPVAKGPSPQASAPEPPSEPAEVRVAWTGSAWTMPDLRGHALRDALRNLEGLGVSLRLEGSGLVASQAPSPGSPVAPGGEVALVLR